MEDESSYLQMDATPEELPVSSRRSRIGTRAGSIVALGALVAAGFIGHAVGHHDLPTFPRRYYPRPLTSLHPGGPASCPNLDGVISSATPPVNLLRRVLLTSERSVVAALHAADPSYWAAVVSAAGTAPTNSVHTAGSPSFATVTQPAPSSDYAASLASTCGRPIVDRSWELLSCPGVSYAACAKAVPGLIGHAFFLNRRGRWLLWYVYP